MLHLNKSQQLTFICENATESDLMLISFGYAMYTIFGENAHLLELTPTVTEQMKYQDIRETNSIPIYSNQIVYHIDVNRECKLPFRAKHPVVINGDCGLAVIPQLKVNNVNNNENKLSYTKVSRNYHQINFVRQLSSALGLNLMFTLVNEVITNGYEHDLLPVDDEIAQQHEECHDLNELRRKYKIFDILDEKMDHEKHKQMNKPLSKFPALLLALILYCNSNCNHDMSLSMRNGDFRKWKVFYQCIESGIFILNKFEEFRNVTFYSGICGVCLNLNDAFSNYKIDYRGLKATMEAPMSFSMNLNVAKRFRGNEGTLIGVKIDNSSDCDFCMASVDWISKFWDENEVLFVNVALNLTPQQCLTDIISNKQWINLTPQYSIKHVFPQLKHAFV